MNSQFITQIKELIKFLCSTIPSPKVQTQVVWVPFLKGEKKACATLCQASPCIEKEKIFTELGEHHIIILLLPSSQEMEQ